MGHKKRRYHADLEQEKGPADFSIQSTPQILRDIGWKFIKELAAAVSTRSSRTRTSAS